MCPIPRVPTTHLPDTPYLGQGSDYGTFHNASKEDQVQFCSSGGVGEGSQVVQDLLHGWGRGSEMLSISWTQKMKIQHKPSHLQPHRSLPTALSTLFSQTLRQRSWGQAIVFLTFFPP